MAKTVTTRLPDNFVSGLKTIAEIEHIDTSTALRKLLADAISEWKKEYAAEQYQKAQFSLEQAAKFAEISVWEFFDLLKQKKIPISYDEEELEAELKSLR